MKIVKILGVLLMGLFLLSSCQKELNFDDVTGVATGGLKYDDVHDCYPSTLNGEYIVDTVLNSTHFVDVQVNAVTTGSYTIGSDTINGYYFRGTGVISVPGLNTVRLYGTGKPIAASVDPDQFIIRWDTSSCIIDVPVMASAVSAEYSFAGAGGTCTGAVLDGIYMKAIPMDASNTVMISLDVTAIGNYSISSDTQNGVTFSGSGVFTATGPQTVFLTATGTPVDTGSLNYVLSSASGSCSFSVTYVPTAGPAVFTLGGNPGTCTAANINGTYQVNAPVSGANFVIVTVDITTTGTYNITTPNVNGISFSASGLFSSTGPSQVTLFASGTPTVVGSFDFQITGGSSTCTFTIQVISASTAIFNAKVNGVFTDFSGNAGATFFTAGNLLFFGDGTDPINLGFSIDNSTAGSVTAATYSTTVAIVNGYIVTASYTDAASAMWSPDVFSLTPDPFSITINSITATNVVGTFSGTVRDNSGTGTNTLSITEGVFDLPIQ